MQGHHKIRSKFLIPYEYRGDGYENAVDSFNPPFSVFIKTAATNVTLDCRAIRPDVPTGVF
jgi:hypothetical protein